MDIVVNHPELSAGLKLCFPQQLEVLKVNCSQLSPVGVIALG